MKADPLIIQHPERQKPLQRATFAIITVAAWAFWISLWLPLLTLCAWLLGLSDAYTQLNMFHPGALGLIPIMGGVCALVFSTWSLYNRARFSVSRRHRTHTSVSVTHMAAALGARVATAEAMRSNRRSIVRFSEGGRMYLEVKRQMPTDRDSHHDHGPRH